MSLQVCSCCGWSKVTTYRGLRIHQGKMGCTAKGVKVEESQQLYMAYGYVEYQNNQKDLGFDVYPIKTDATDYYSDMSLQVCHCGWSKVTTFHGLRTHQGMMGCTSRRATIPKREQPDWKDQWKEVDQSKHQLAKTTTIKNEKAPLLQSTNSCTISAEITGTIKLEYKSSRSSQRATDSNSGRQLQDFSTHPQKADSRATTRHWSYTDSATAATIKEEPKTPTLPRSSQRATDSKAGRQLQDFYPYPQVDRLDREHPRPTYPVTVAQPKNKDRKEQTLAQTISDRRETTITIKEQPRSPLAIPQQPSQRATNSKSGRRLQDFSTHLQKADSRATTRHWSYTDSATAATIKEEPKTPTLPRSSQRAANSKAGRQLQDFYPYPQVDRLDREHPRPTYPVTVAQPKNKDRKEQTLAQTISDRRETTITIKEQPRSPLAIPQQPSQRATNSKSGRQLQEFSTGVTVVRPKEKDRKDQPSQVKRLDRERPANTHPATVARPKEQDKENVPLSPSINSATTKPAFATPQRPLRNSKSSHQLKDFCAGVQARQEGFQSELQKKLQMRAIKAAETASERDPDSTSSNGQANSAAAEARDTTSLCETAQPDFSAGLKFKELARMFSATTTQETAVQPKRKHREEEKLSQVKPLALRPSEATTAQETTVQPEEKDREDPKLPQNVPDSTSATAQMNPASAETTSEEDPNIDFSNMKLASSVKDLARMFSAATTQETAVRPKGKHGEEQNVKPLAQKLSTTTAQETAVHRKEKDKEVQNLTKVRSDRITAKHKIQMTEQNVPQGRSSIKASQPFQARLEAEWLEINSVISEVVKVAEAAKQNSIYLSMYTLRTTTSTMVEQIQQKLEQLFALELKWISKFSVNVKLDPTTAYRCLVSADGKKVSSGEKNQEAPGGFGSVLGFNNLTSGKSYWEVVVSNKTGWKLGVARGDANHEGTLSLNPDKGFWITEYYKNKYTALTTPPVGLSLKEKPQKVGVFMDYEEGVVSFYDVTNQCQIYAFTECSFTGEIYPYLSLHLKEDGERSDPLIVSTLKAQ